MERVTFMYVEGNYASLEKTDGSIIYYPCEEIPEEYAPGDIIKVNIYNSGYIEFCDIDICEMERRRANAVSKKLSLRERLRKRAK